MCALSVLCNISYFPSDIEPPKIVCPNNITVEADLDANDAEVTWSLPVTTDNSGYVPAISVVPALIPPLRMPIGETSATYIAEDTLKNQASCSFVINVRGQLSFCVENKKKWN